MNSMTTGGSYDKHLEQIGAFSDTDPKELAYEIGKHWERYEWEKGETLDTDAEEREEYCVMTCEVEGFTFEGTGTYSCGELILIDNITPKPQ